MNLHETMLIFLSIIFMLTSKVQPSTHEQDSIKNRIVGGIPAEKDEIPYQVSLRYQNKHICGGSLITTRHVLTAAHCLYSEHNAGVVTGKWMKLPIMSLSVFAGDINVNGLNGFKRRVLKTFVHPDYMANALPNDVAVLKLRQRFVLSNAIKTIKMRNSSIDDLKERLCLVSGWGSKSLKGGGSQKLMKVYVPVHNHTVCAKQYKTTVDSNMICAGYEAGGKDSCKGDSGGPLVCENELTGIVSFGKDCGSEYYGVYMNVFKFRHWIVSSVNTGSILSPNIIFLFCSCLLFYFGIYKTT